MLKINVITPFPEMFEGIITSSILLKGKQKGIVSYNIINLFDYLDDPNQRIDDYPYGGGEGMILKPEPIFEAFNSIKKNLNESSRIIYPTPDGVLLNHTVSLLGKEFIFPTELIIGGIGILLLFALKIGAKAVPHSTAANQPALQWVKIFILDFFL